MMPKLVRLEDLERYQWGSEVGEVTDFIKVLTQLKIINRRPFLVSKLEYRF